MPPTNMDPKQVFAEAQSAFQLALTSEQQSDFKTYENSDQMLVDVASLAENFRHTFRFKKAFKRVDDFRVALQPYFDVVNICVQSHPEYSALVWGALRFILLLASNYATFFEKVTMILESVSDKLKRWESMYRDLQNVATRLKDKTCSFRTKISLGKVYNSLLCLLQTIVSIFTKKNGDSRRVVRVVGSLMWKPFDVRFSGLLSTLDDAFDAVQDDYKALKVGIDIMSYDEAAKERSKAEEERKLASSARAMTEDQRNMLESISDTVAEHHSEFNFATTQRWLAPPNYAQELINKRRDHEFGTGEWFFEEPNFMNWLVSNDSVSKPGEKEPISEDSEGPEPMNSSDDIQPDLQSAPLLQDQPELELEQEPVHSYMIQGKPGAGKSVLAALTIDRLLERDASRVSKKPIFYFFFRYDDPSFSTSSSACRAILAQILAQSRGNKQIIDAFMVVQHEKSSGQLTATDEELKDLMHVALTIFGSGYIVLDGVDECENPDDLGALLDSVMRVSGYNVLLFSRPILPATAIPEATTFLSIGSR